MSLDEIAMAASNVAIVESQDSNSLATLAISSGDFFRFTGDTTETIELAVEAPVFSQPPLLSEVEGLFGSWVECRKEDAMLDELYESRLIPSSLPSEGQ